MGTRGCAPVVEQLNTTPLSYAYANYSSLRLYYALGFSWTLGYALCLPSAHSEGDIVFSLTKRERE